MNILFLLKILNTTKLSELVANIDTAPLDYNLAIWEAINKGEIKVDEKKDEITVLKEAKPTNDYPELAEKLLKTIQHYAKNGSNATRGRLNATIKDAMSGKGYAWHEYIMSLQYLIDTGAVEQEELTVPKTKKRHGHVFAFLGLPGNDNREMNAKAVNKWISQTEAELAKKR